jgi:esterase/lipase superfamily enzyme
MDTKDQKTKAYYKIYNVKNKYHITKIRNDYYKNNIDVIKLKHAEYRKNNQARIKKYKKIKIMCTCGIEISKINKARHCKTKKHLSKIVN